jgi:hypothetical protein
MANFVSVKEHIELSGSIADNEFLINPDAISHVLIHSVNIGDTGNKKTTASIYAIGCPGPLIKVDEQQIGPLLEALGYRATK